MVLSHLWGILPYPNFFEPNLKKFVSTGDFTLGKELEKFEKNFSKLIGTKYAIGVNSGTDAIKLSLRALNIGYGDEVIMFFWWYGCPKKSAKQYS